MSTIIWLLPLNVHILMLLLTCKRFYFFCGGWIMKNDKQVTEAPVNFGTNLGLILELYDQF